MKEKLRFIYSLYLLFLVISFIAGCSTWRKLNNIEKGAVIGGGSGAVLGGAVGGGTGAIVGGAGGAVAGGVIGHESDEEDRRRHSR